MALINKYSRGAEIKRRDSLKQLVLIAYQNASPDILQKLDAVSLSYLNYQNADTLGSRDARRLEIDAYERMLDIANGGTGYNPTNAGSATANFFGNYSSNEIQNIGNEITKKTLQKKSTVSEKQTTGSLPTTSVGHYSFAWNNGLDTDYFGENADLRTRAGSFIETLKNNISAALEAKNSGKTLHGIDNSVVASLPAILNTLNSDSFNTNTWDISNLEGLNTRIEYLKNVAQKLKIPYADFSTFFAEWTNPTEDIINKRNLTSLGYTFANPIINGVDLKDIFEKNNWNYATKNGKHYVFDNKWKEINTPYSEIYDDQDNTNFYGKGLFVNSKGELTFGNISDYNDTNNPWNQQVSNALESLRKQREDVVLSWDYDKIYGISKSDLVNEIASKIGNNFSYVDVSRQFKGNDTIIAVLPPGKKADEIYDEFGNIDKNIPVTYMYKGSDGTLKSAKSREELLKQLNTQYNYKGFEGETVNPDTMSDTMKIKGDTTIKDDDDFAARSWWARTLGSIGMGAAAGAGIGTLAGGPGIGTGIGAVAGTIGGPIWYDTLDNINEDPQTWFNMMITALSDPNGDNAPEIGGVEGFNVSNRTLINDFGGPDNIVPYLAKLLRNGTVKLDKKDLYKWRAIIKDYYNNKQYEESGEMPATQKNGGILKALAGKKLYKSDDPSNIESYKDPKTYLTEKNLKEERELEKKAKEAGYATSAEYVDNMRTPSKDLSPNDFIRFGAIAADIASIPASWVAGYGTAAAAALGVGSTIATLYTDIADDGFQWHDITGLGINLALDVAGLVGGAGKAGKIIKNITKFVPFLMGAWDGIANGEDYKKALTKLTNKEKMTVEDWKTLARGVSIIASANRVSAQSFKAKNIKNNVKIGDVKLTSVKLQVDNKGKKETIEIKDPDKIAAIKNANSIDEVNTTLATLNKEGSDYKAIPNKSMLWKFWKGKVDNDKNPYNKQLIDLENLSTEAARSNPELLRNAANARYYNPELNRNWFSNRINKWGNRRGFASDLDYVTGNASWLKTKSLNNKNTQSVKKPVLLLPPALQKTSTTALNPVNPVPAVEPTISTSSGTFNPVPRPAPASFTPGSNSTPVSNTTPVRTKGPAYTPKNTTKSAEHLHRKEVHEKRGALYLKGRGIRASRATALYVQEFNAKHTKNPIVRTLTFYKALKAGKFTLEEFKQNPTKYRSKYAFSDGGKLERLVEYINKQNK